MNTSTMTTLALLTAMTLATGCMRAAAPAATPAAPAAPETSMSIKDNDRLDLDRCVGIGPDELERLRSAWRGSGAAHEAVAAFVEDIRAQIGRGPSIPPEGGQHNQWYQCDACQMHLETIDAHHHKCPSCGKIYSGWPYDNVLYNNRHHHNGRLAQAAAECWAITGERPFADFAAALLEGYAGLYTTLPRIAASTPKRPLPREDRAYSSGGHISNQTLNEAMLMVQFASAVDILTHYEGLDASAAETVNSGLIRPMAESIRAGRRGKSNWQTWHNAALIHAAAVLDDPALADFALNDPENGFYRQMEISVLPGGVWYENSWGYHYYTLRAMTDIAEAVRRLGGDVYDTRELRSMYLAVFDFVMPGGRLPRLGDATGEGNFRHDLVNEPACAYYGDEALASALPEEPTLLSVRYGRDTSRRPRRPAPASLVRPHSGQAILRSGPGIDPAAAAVLNFGPYGGFHGHYDKLSVVYYAGGLEMAVDPGRAFSQAYRLPIHRQWYKSTLSHNTVMIDGADQQPVTGTLYASDFTDDYAAASAGAPGAFAGASHDRLAVLAGETLILIDEIASLDGQPHRFDWLYHNTGQAALVVPEILKKQETLPLPEHPGTAYLKTIEARLNARNAVFLLDNKSILDLRLDAVGVDAFTLTSADGPFESVEQRAGCVILSGQSDHAFVVAVMSPIGTDRFPRVTTTHDDGLANLKVAVEIEGRAPLTITIPTAIAHGFLINDQ